MMPGFGAPEARTYLPIFFGAAGKVNDCYLEDSTRPNIEHQVTRKWQDLIAADASQTTVVSLPWWVARATLDAIGEGQSKSHSLERD